MLAQSGGPCGPACISCLSLGDFAWVFLICCFINTTFTSHAYFSTQAQGTLKISGDQWGSRRLCAVNPLFITRSFSPAETSYIHSGMTRHRFSRKPYNGIVWLRDAENHYSEPSPFLFQFAALFMKTGLLWWMKKSLACFLPWQLVSLAKARGDGCSGAWRAEEAAWEWIYSSKRCYNFPCPLPT